MSYLIRDAQFGYKLHDDKLLVICSPYYRCSVKIGILNGNKVEFWRYATLDEEKHYAELVDNPYNP